MIAGKPANFPGVGQSVVGMAVGRKNQVRIPGESAYVRPEPGKIQSFPAVWTSPRTVRLAPAAFLTRFQASPILGTEVQFTPFLKASVREVSDTMVVLELMAKNGEKHTEEFGTITIGLGQKGDEVVATLVPIIGAAFRTASAEGRIAGFDGKSFTVDFNPPLAGRPVVLDIEVVAVTRASELAGMQIPWMEDHDKGLLAAKEAQKPAVMLLYADWCGWCKKLENETFPDPRIKVLRDRLTFIKVNSGRQKDVQKKYGQKGFPLVILFNRKGEMAGRIDGYRDAPGLRRALDGLIDDGTAAGFSKPPVNG
jgi:FKBP-type peptidyl-prolyl cis-trans isomerase 2